MLRGLTTASSGMLADERLQQMLANNLANAQTPGFKSSDGSLLMFPQQLLQQMNYGENGGTTIGKTGTGVVFQEGVPLFIQGMLQNSGRNLDVALVDSTPSGTYAAVAAPGAAGGSAVGQAGASPTGQAGAAATGQALPASVQGTVVAGPGGQLTIHGQPLAVLNANGQVQPGMYAAVNPQYQGTALYAADGKPNYDANNNPSYVFVDGKGALAGVPGQSGFDGLSIRTGTDANMGAHSFFAVAYQSPDGPGGIALTRDGHLDVNANHQLVDAAGNAILPVGANGQPIVSGRIVLNANYQGTDLFGPGGEPVVDKSGQPSYRVTDTAGNPLPGAKLGSVNADVSQLTPLGQTEFMVAGTLNAAQVTGLLQTGTASLKSGEVEQSNVDMTATMGKMMSVISQYEANQRVIQTEDTLLGEAVQQVGKV